MDRGQGNQGIQTSSHRNNSSSNHKSCRATPRLLAAANHPLPLDYLAGKWGPSGAGAGPEGTSSFHEATHLFLACFDPGDDASGGVGGSSAFEYLNPCSAEDQDYGKDCLRAVKIWKNVKASWSFKLRTGAVFLERKGLIGYPGQPRVLAPMARWPPVGRRVSARTTGPPKLPNKGKVGPANPEAAHTTALNNR